MFKSKFTTRIFTLIILVLFLTTSAVNGVELWSEDWWPSITNPPPSNQANTNTNSGGLWSEDLWKTPSPEPTKPTLNSDFNYFGVWEICMDGFAGGLVLGNLIVQEDGTYGMRHSLNGTSVGTWRQGERDEILGYKDVLILEDGPGGMDWAMVPKKDGLVGIRYHYGNAPQAKIWFEDSLGIKLDN